MKLSLSLIGLTMSLAAANVQAGEFKNWGLVNQSYTVGASQLVAKDQGSLAISLQLNCIESASDIAPLMSEMVGRLDQEITRESKYALVSKNPEISISSQNQYEMRYDEKDVQQLTATYVDVCSGARVNIGARAIDLTKKVFTASANITIETKDSLAGLTVLRQKLQQFAEISNKAENRKQISVGTESIVVSAEKRNEVLSTLGEQNHLVGDLAKDTRMKLDQSLAGGFSELYITAVSSEADQLPDYARYTPVLIEDGKSKITVPYTFNVQYSPKNIATNRNNPYPGNEPGELTKQVNGVVVVSPDYYVAQLRFTTVCQPSKKAAIESMASAFEQFKKSAQAVINPTKDNPYERLEERIGTPNQDGLWTPWEREFLKGGDTLSGQGQRLVVKSYISLCNGSVAGEVKEANWTYSVSHTLTLVTSNFAGLKILAEGANSYTQDQRNTSGSSRVEVQLGAISPKLKDAKQFEVVDVLAYRSALDQFIDPNGVVSKTLLDEIQAGEAYYTATRGYDSQARMERAAPAPAGAAPRADMAPSYKVVVTSDGNIPMSEIRLNTTYNVTYRPKKDLIQILTEARGNGATRIGSPR